MINRKLCCTLLVAMTIALAGCSSNTISSEEAEKQLKSYVQSEESSTSQMISSAKDYSKTAIMQYLDKMSITDFVCDSSSGTVTISCSVGYPTVSSLQKQLWKSDNFTSEYKTSDNKDKTVYSYLVNILMAENGIDMTQDKVTATGTSVEEAMYSLKSQVDNVTQKRTGEFALAKYDENGSEQTQDCMESSEDFNDFIFSEGKQKILVSNISVVSGSDAIKKLESMSENNSLIKLNSSDVLVVAEYRMTNLSEEPATVSNGFYLGSKQGTVYQNSGFHVEGLSASSVEIKNGKSADFIMALVGDSESVLYFCDKEMTCKRYWSSLPVPK